MTLKTLQIENFQSHKNTFLDFHKGVNVIIGSTDEGKSAILRDLNLIINNVPSGTDYISDWAKSTITTLKTEEDNEVLRARGRTQTNIYSINDKDPLEGFGQGSVPEEVSEILNISDVNIQNQLDGPFLLTKGSGDVAKYLNKAVNLEKISSAQVNIVSMGRKAASDKKSFQSDLEKDQEKLKDLEWIDNFEKELLIIELSEKNIKDIEKKLDNLDSLLNDIDDHEKAIKDQEKISGCLKQINKLIKIDEDLKARITWNNALENLIFDIKDSEEKIKKNERISKNLSEIERLITLDKKIKSRDARLDNIADLIDDIERTEKNIKDEEANFKKYNSEFHKLMPDVCPLCGR